MKLIHLTILPATLMAASLCLTGCQTPMRSSSSATKLGADSQAALRNLYSKNEAARNLGRQADSILVFPKIIRAGFVFGGAHGNGVLFRDGRVVDYYKSVGASWGLQAGAQQTSYAVFIMDRKALAKLNRQKGWEIGGAPTLTVVDVGISKSLSTKTVTKGIYAFIFGQKGLMAGLGLQGTKISRIRPAP